MTLSTGAAYLLVGIVGALVGAGLLAGIWWYNVCRTYYTVSCPNCDKETTILQRLGYHHAMDKIMYFTMAHANCTKKPPQEATEHIIVNGEL